MSIVPEVEYPGQVIDPRRGQAEIGRTEPEIVRDGLPGVEHAVAEPGAFDGTALVNGAHERGQGIGVVEEPRVRTELFHVPGDGDEFRDVPQGAEDAARSDAIADGLIDAVRFGDADISLPGPRSADGDS